MLASKHARASIFNMPLHRTQKKHLTLTYLWLGALLVVGVGLALSHGAVSFSWAEILQPFTLPDSSAFSPAHSTPYSNPYTTSYTATQIILWEIRVPRIVLALCIGSVLAGCGVMTQGLFRNPLADPALIGVTAGASAGASLAIAFGLGISNYFTPTSTNIVMEYTSHFLNLLSLNTVSLGAFLGALGAMCLILTLTQQGEHPAIGTLLMTGLALTAFVGGFTQLMSNLVDDATLRQLSLWHMGGLSGATANQCILAAAVAALVYFAGQRRARALDALALGETQAASLGVALAPLKRSLILMTAIGIGISVTLTGTIAFVGLVVPHIMRQLIGPSHRHLLPTSCLAGALLLLLADTIARCILAPTELPVGALTTLLGAPFFLILLLRRRAWLSGFS